MRCLDCATTQPGHARFCGSCGARLVARAGGDLPSERPTAPTVGIAGRVGRQGAVAIGLGAAFAALTVWGLVSAPDDQNVAGRVDVPAVPDAPVVPRPNGETSARRAELPGVATVATDCEGPLGARTSGCTWTVETLRPGTPLGALIIDDERVFVPVGQQVIALDAANGEVVWATDLGVQVDPAAAVTSNRVYVIDAANRLTALDRWSGLAVWQVPVGRARDPVVTREVVVLAQAGRLSAYSRVDGRPRWELTVSGLVSTPVVARDSWIVFGDGQGDVRCVDAATGRILWKTAAERWQVAVGEPEELVFATGFGAGLTALDLDDGQVRWTSDAVAAWSEPVLGRDGLVVYATGEGHVQAIDPDTGRAHALVAASATARVIDAGPHLLVVGGDDVRLVTAGGEVVWERAATPAVRELSVGWAGGVAFLATVEDGGSRLRAHPLVEPG